MKKQAKIGCMVSVFYVLVSLPISLWLQYQILSRVGATDLMWFLFWVNVPVAFGMSFMSQAAMNIFKD